MNSKLQRPKRLHSSVSFEEDIKFPLDYKEPLIEIYRKTPKSKIWTVGYDLVCCPLALTRMGEWIVLTVMGQRCREQSGFYSWGKTKKIGRIQTSTYLYARFGDLTNAVVCANILANLPLNDRSLFLPKDEPDEFEIYLAKVIDSGLPEDYSVFTLGKEIYERV